MVIGFGNLNGAVSSNIYRAQDAPRYVLGHSVVLGYIALGFVCAWHPRQFLTLSTYCADGSALLRLICRLGAQHVAPQPRERRPGQWRGTYSSLAPVPAPVAPAAHLPPPPPLSLPQRDELIEPNGSELGDKPFKNADGVMTFTSHEQARIALGDKHSSFRCVLFRDAPRLPSPPVPRLTCSPRLQLPHLSGRSFGRPAAPTANHVPPLNHQLSRLPLLERLAPSSSRSPLYPGPLLSLFLAQGARHHHARRSILVTRVEQVDDLDRLLCPRQRNLLARHGPRLCPPAPAHLRRRPSPGRRQRRERRRRLVLLRLAVVVARARGAAAVGLELGHERPERLRRRRRRGVLVVRVRVLRMVVLVAAVGRRAGE